MSSTQDSPMFRCRVECPHIMLQRDFANCWACARWILRYITDNLVDLPEDPALALAATSELARPIQGEPLCGGDVVMMMMPAEDGSSRPHVGVLIDATRVAHWVVDAKHGGRVVIDAAGRLRRAGTITGYLRLKQLEWTNAQRIRMDAEQLGEEVRSG
jgi:hypothetical protein